MGLLSGNPTTTTNSTPLQEGLTALLPQNLPTQAFPTDLVP